MNLSSRSIRRPKLPTRPTLRLEVERLEQRWVPSTVLNLSDSGAGSLRQAILDTPAGGTIDFQSGLTGAITLTSGELAINNDLTITGPGAGVITVSGNQASRVFDITGAFTVAVSGLTIANGMSSTDGGGIYNGGTLALTNSTLNGNSVASAEIDTGGGGIWNGGTLTVTASTFSGNKAGNRGGGGAIDNDYGGTLTVTDSTFQDNQGQYGGGIINFNSLTITGSTVTGNTGHGIFNNSGMLTLTSCTITDNGGPGVQFGGTGTITASTISGNSGGGIAAFGGTLTVSDSTINGNSSTIGGGIYSLGTLTVINSTITGNTATYSDGGGVHSEGPLSIVNCTITDNSAASEGGGLDLTSGWGPQVNHIVNAIVAGNAAPLAPDVNGTLSSQGHNLIGDGSGGSGYVTTDLVGTTAQPIDPALGPLQDNGGPTQTMALLPGSPAVDAGDNAYSPGPYDQRGPGFGRIANGTIDMGAYELHTLVVQNTNDAGTGSLRQAITDANATPGQTIVFAHGVTGTINLDTPLPDLGGNIDLIGPGANSLTVTRGVSNTFMIFFVEPGTIATISGLTITGGGVGGAGGAILNDGTMTVSSCTISNSSAYVGGGIDNKGTMTLSGSTISGNSAVSHIVTTSMPSGLLGPPTVVPGTGGGICNEGTMTIVNCTIASNTAKGGFDGGIANLASATLTIRSSTVALNAADGDSGIANFAPAANLVIQDTIFAQNEGGSDVAGSFTSLGHNLIGDGSVGKGFVSTDLVGTKANPIDPKLGPLQNNGGPTQTMALVAGSPAINAGDNSASPGPYDQRGVGFPRIVNEIIDIGAFEYQVSIPYAIVVQNLNDSGPGSLREAISDANDSPGDDTITFAPGLTGTIHLASALPTLSTDIDLEGPGPAYITVQGSTFTVGQTVDVTIAGLTITGASDGIDHGTTLPVSSGGSLTVRNCSIAHNSGDGISSLIQFSLNVSDCTIANNGGTGISNATSYSPGKVVTISNCTIANNTAAGIANAGMAYDAGENNPQQGGQMTVSNCTISGNSIQGIGGGISNGGMLALSDCTIAGNHGGGVNGGSGGGIWNDGVMTLSSSTISNNTASGYSSVNPNFPMQFPTFVPGTGGGIYNAGTITIVNCTITNNTAAGGNGGGITNAGSGTLSISNSTVALNVATTGAGIDNQGSASSTVIYDTILAKNQGSTPDLAGSFTSQGRNLIGDGTGARGFISTDLVGTSANPIDARLGPLQNNGGPTETMALLSGSPALGAGDPANAPPWDQRGPGFPRVVNGEIDIGAFEVQLAVASLVGCDAATGQWWVSKSTGSSFQTSVADAWSPNVSWVNVQTGDFTGNGASDIIGMVQETGQWFVSVPDSQGHFTTRLWDAWSSKCTWTVCVGDVNGDGKDDIVGYAQQTGQWYVGLSTGSSFTTSFWDAWNPNIPWTNMMVGDFTGNGKADIVAYAKNTGQWWVGLSNGSAFHPSLWDVWNPNVTWVNVQLGDFNGDGRMDLVGRVEQYGQWWVGLSTGISFETTLWDAWSTGVTWEDVMVGDFNGDGKADIIGRALQTGQWWMGESTGMAFQSSVWDVWSTGVTWVDVQVGDFNGDGRSDIAGMAEQTGQWFVGVSKAQGGFATSLWDAWNPGIAWSDVQTMKLR